MVRRPSRSVTSPVASTVRATNSISRLLASVAYSPVMMKTPSVVRTPSVAPRLAQLSAQSTWAAPLLAAAFS